MVSADAKSAPSKANGAAWIFAVAAASSLAVQSARRVEPIAGAPFLGALGPIAGSSVVELVLGILVALAVPWFEVAVPRRKVIVAAVAVGGIGTGMVIALDTGGHFELVPVILLTISATVARGLSVIGDVSYVGLLSHEKRVSRYFVKYFGAGTAVLCLQSMALFSRNLFGREAVIRDLLGAGVALVLLAALLWRILPDFGERDAPSPHASWRTAFLGAIDELRKLILLWPTVAVFTLLPLPTEALRQVARMMLLGTLVDGGFELSNVDVGTIFGIWANLATFAGLLGGWFALRRIEPERLVRLAVAVSAIGVLAWPALAISRPTDLLWVTVAACLDALCQGFIGVIVLLLAMKTFGTLRHYATGYVWLVSLTEVLDSVARMPTQWFTDKFGIVTTTQVFALATLIVTALCIALWSRPPRRVEV